MRISNSMVYNMVQSNLSKSTEDLNKATETAMTGKRILDLSDDPIGLTKTLGIQSALDGFDQVERAITLGNSWLTASENALAQSQDLITNTKTLAIQMANAPISSAERTAAAEIVQNTMEELVSLANTKVDDRYIFSGSQTDVQPFELDEDGLVSEYQGDSNAFSIEIGESSMAIGNDGGDVFSDIFETLALFKTALENDDLDGIQSAMTNLEHDFDTLNEAITTVGTKMNRMDIKETLYQDMTLRETERLSDIEDADITEAYTTLQQKQLVYQSALASSAKVMKLSLLDYL